MTELSEEVQATIAQVIASDDPLDKSDFDVIDFINTAFPDEQSLKKVREFGNNLQGKITEIDDELSRAIQEQSTAGRRAAQDITDANQAIYELFQKVKDIKAKARQSEMMVAEICKDIKQLDFAKRHLQSTITGLHRLHMLITAVDQLTFMSQQRKYREAADLVGSVRGLLEHFDQYAEVPKIVELRSAVSNLRSELRHQVLSEFQTVGELGSAAGGGVMNPALLRDACAVAQALGPSARNELLRTFVKQQLRAYNITFQRGGEFTGLEHADRRFSWFKRLLRGLETECSEVFPKVWRVEHYLCVQFGKALREWIMAELQAQQEQIEVAVLLRGLQKTLVFEKEMSQKYDIRVLGTSGVGDGDGGGADTELIDDEGNPVDPDSAAGIRLKYQRQQRGDAGGGAAQESGAGPANNDGATEPERLVGLVSTCFDPFMMPYILLERKNMKDMMEKVRTEESVNRNDQLPVLSSSLDMFVYIKNSIRRCTALSTGETFSKLFCEFQACLDNYAGTLRGKLPAASHIATLGCEGYRLAPDQEVEVCYIANTAEYCAENLPKLQDHVEDKIDERFKESIDLDPQIDGFHDVAAHAVKTLVSGAEVRLEGAFTSMSKINWAALEDVGDQSQYVVAMADVVNNFFPKLRSTINPLYFRNVCDKFAMALVPRYLSTIHRLKRVSEMGINQLLLDTTALRGIMLKLPLLGEPPTAFADRAGADTVPASFKKFVEREMKKVETTLKLVQTPPDMLIQRFKRMWPDGSGSDLQKILAMKGMKQGEQKSYISMLGRGDADVAPDNGTAPGSSLMSDGMHRVAGGMSGVMKQAGGMMEGAKDRMMGLK